MSTELTLLTPVLDVFRPDVELADPTLLIPTESDALLQGEWLVRNTAGKYERVGSSVRGAVQIWTQRGDTAAQAIGKICVLQLHEYEAETTIFADGLAPAIGDPLTVKTSTVDGVAGRAALAAATSGNFIYGFVTKPPADNNGKLRFQKLPSLVPLA